KRPIHIHSARVGNVPGEHQVVFATDEEMITVSHRALSREAFAKGALRAARYLVTQPKGMFTMRDLIEAQHG
ncbi:MAG: 4-hydroxy-tetrahydrodipicolinate reductase, partial [Candidatus Latescibacterota bacterium]